MVVGFDTTPESSGHSFRGIGSYAHNLKKALISLETDLKIDSHGHSPWSSLSRKLEIKFFDKALESGNYDLVHHPYFDLFFHTLPVKKATKKRIVTIHDVIPLLFPDKFPAGIKGFINLFLQKQALKNVDLIICDSETSKKDIVDKLSVHFSKIKVIYLAAGDEFKKKPDLKKLKAVQEKYKLPKNFCLYVGDVNWNKNIENLLEAVSVSKTQVVMVGKALAETGLSQVTRINGVIRRLKLESKVIKTGFIPNEDLVSIYNLAQVTLLPSFYEGFGLPVLESMACGTPVVCSNNSSLAEIAGSAAIFCDPSDPKDIADKISGVLSLKGKNRESLSQKCINQALKFSWQKAARETIDLYKKVLAA